MPEKKNNILVVEKGRSWILKNRNAPIKNAKTKQTAAIFFNEIIGIKIGFILNYRDFDRNFGANRLNLLFRILSSSRNLRIATNR